MGFSPARPANRIFTDHVRNSPRPLSVALAHGHEIECGLGEDGMAVVDLAPPGLETAPDRSTLDACPSDGVLGQARQDARVGDARCGGGAMTRLGPHTSIFARQGVPTILRM